MKKRNIIYSLGAIATAGLPVISLVSCAEDNKKVKLKTTQVQTPDTPSSKKPPVQTPSPSFYKEQIKKYTSEIKDTNEKYDKLINEREEQATKELAEYKKELYDWLVHSDTFAEFIRKNIKPNNGKGSHKDWGYPKWKGIMDKYYGRADWDNREDKDTRGLGGYLLRSWSDELIPLLPGTPVTGLNKTIGQDLRFSRREEILEQKDKDIKKINEKSDEEISLLESERQDARLKVESERQDARLKGSLTWESKLITPKKEFITFVWNADETNSIKDIIDQMDKSIHFRPTKKVQDFTPAEMVQFVIDLYNNTNGGRVKFKLIYKGKEDIVQFDFSQLILPLIRSFDDPKHLITENTKRATETSVTNALGKIPGNSGMLKGVSFLTKIFGDYIEDVFGVGIGGLGLQIFVGGNGAEKALKFLNLLIALSPKTVKEFKNLIGIVNDMAGVFKKSKLAQEWAKDHNLTKRFKKLEHAMVKEMMGG